MNVQLLTAAELTELCSDAGSRGGIVALQARLIVVAV